MKPKYKLLLLLSMLSMGISACSTAFSTHIKPNGSGVFSIMVTVSDRDITFLENEENQNLADIMMDRYQTADKKQVCEMQVEEGDYPFPATVKYKESRNDFTCEILMKFEDLDELVNIYDELFYGLRGNVSMDEFGELNYVMGIKADQFDSAEELGVPSIEYYWSVSPPGEISNHNAESQRGDLLTWELLPDGEKTIEVISTPKTSVISPPSGFPFWLLIFPVLACLCLISLATIGVIIYLLIRRNQNV